jgi:hypothetical protein
LIHQVKQNSRDSNSINNGRVVRAVTHEDGIKFMHVELKVQTDGYSPMKKAAAPDSPAPVKKMNSSVIHIELPSYSGTHTVVYGRPLWPLPLLDLSYRSPMRKRIPLTTMMRTLQSRVMLGLMPSLVPLQCLFVTEEPAQDPFLELWHPNLW